ncbi:MAG: hypothetical protein ACE15D_06445 [Candidatus Eisenbacteria bacterium]|nr:hypothetical protein [Candidatus Eisenbacteria bacterium]
MIWWWDQRCPGRIAVLRGRRAVFCGPTAGVLRRPPRALSALLLLAGSLVFAGAWPAAPASATVFSRDGWGWWWYSGDPAARGRGGTEIAVTGYGVTGELNPAAIGLSDIPYGYASYAGEVDNAKARGDGATFRQRSDLLPHFGGVARLPRGLRAGAAFLTVTDASFDRVQRIGGEQADAFDFETKGSGGWNGVRLSLAGPAFERKLLWGATIGRIQGTVKEQWRYDFVESSATDLRQVLEGRLDGAWRLTAGLIARPHERIAAGAFVTPETSSDMEQVVTVVEGAKEQVTTRGKQEIPGQWGLGGHAALTGRLAVSADFVRTLWGEAALRLDPDRSRKSFPYFDTSRFGIGLEYTAARSEEQPLPRWVVRGGYAQDEYYVRTTGGEKVRERAVTLGAGARTAAGRAAIDLSLELGKRGDRSKVGVEESFTRILLGVTFSSVVREY